ncbi:MAG: GvpL/GvpF family gas vesicle protein, partial [Actinomycetota bacterium]|nr:GvpL/GvpF family gas vesicle protein [Actinomycetota bacterium]
MVYVYAVTGPLGEAPAGNGLDGAPLRIVTTDELAAVVSDGDDAPVRVSEGVLWAHERVVEDLMADRPVLPMRFGSALRDDDAVRAMLVTRGEELAAALRRVSGAVEL